METTLSSKGQIVIPRKIRKSHGWGAGICFTIIDEGDALILKPAVTRKTTALEDVIGCAGYTGPKKSLADMEEGIFEEARKKAALWSR